MTKRAFLIHGVSGSPKKHWLPWLKGELEKKGFAVFAPQMPNAKNPKMDEWVNCLSKIVGKSDENCYFVGHSLGCIAILRYIEALKEKNRVGGAVLVAGFSDDLGRKELHDFYTKPIDWEKIKSHCKKFAAIHSDNDKTVPLKHAGIFNEKLNANIIIKHGMGHFTSEPQTSPKVSELPEALEFVLKMVE